MLNLCSDFINWIHLEVVALFAFLSFGIIFKSGEVIKPKKGVCTGGAEAVLGGAVAACPSNCSDTPAGNVLSLRTSSPPESGYKAGTGRFKTF